MPPYTPALSAELMEELGASKVNYRTEDLDAPTGPVLPEKF